MNCDNCDNKATCNYQLIWARYSYNAKTETYGKRKIDDTGLNTDPNGEDNKHLCKVCEELFLTGGI